MKKKAELTSIEVLGIAISRERESTFLYKKMSKKIKNPLSKKRVLELARDEAEHGKILADIYTRETGEKPEKIKTQQYPEHIAKLEKLSIEKLIEYALKKEKEAIKFYRENAKKIKDQSGRFMLEYLSGFEKSHQIALEEELKTIKRFPEWMEREDVFRLVNIGP